MKISRPCLSCPSLALSLAAVLALGAATTAPAAPVVLAAQQAAGATGAAALNPRHPDRYVVKRGDTLWDISATFLRDPWYWPEIWHVNPQIENPHLIYPGDVLTLVYVDGKPQLQLQRGSAGTAGTEKLSPRVREESLEDAIPTIPLDVIRPFLSRGVVLEKDEVDKLPYVVAIRGEHLVGAAGNDLYVRGKVEGVGYGYSIVHPGDKLIDPDTGKVVGYEGVYVGGGTIQQVGDPSTLYMEASSREVLEGDRLISQSLRYPATFQPRPPKQPVDGSIIHVVDGVSQIGQYQIVILNRGTSDGLEPGNVLRIWQVGDVVDDNPKPGRISRKAQLPDHPAGLLIVFRTYDRLSYGLVVQATGEIHVLDKVRNPT
jgi:hypothetical protein